MPKRRADTPFGSRCCPASCTDRSSPGSNCSASYIRSRSSPTVGSLQRSRPCGPPVRRNLEAARRRRSDPRCASRQELGDRPTCRIGRPRRRAPHRRRILACSLRSTLSRFTGVGSSSPRNGEGREMTAPYVLPRRAVPLLHPAVVVDAALPHALVLGNPRRAFRRERPAQSGWTALRNDVRASGMLHADEVGEPSHGKTVNAHWHSQCGGTYSVPHGVD